MDVKWQVKPFDQLDPFVLYAILRLRVDVFVVEQSCPYPELDGKDILEGTRHLWAQDQDGAVVAYLRILGPENGYTGLGRVVTVPVNRGRGVARNLLARGLAEASRLWPAYPVKISAQEYLVAFYGEYGFVSVSSPYLEDGIPHVDMVLKRGQN